VHNAKTLKTGRALEKSPDIVTRPAGTAGRFCYTVRQAACDLRKLRGKNLAAKPGRCRRYDIPSAVPETTARIDA
jgi:hypothetical protein